MNHLCKYCDTIMYDENPQIDAKFLDTTNLVVLEMVALEDGVGGFFWACPLCLTDSYLTDLPQN